MGRSVDPYAELLAATAGGRDALLRHPIYRAVSDPSALARFMETHVFAVWDFMSLLKALQRAVTCVEVPWTPPRSRVAARLVNEIVLGEESDAIAPGVTMSHFELYLEAMREVGADAEPVARFVEAVGAGAKVTEALVDAGAPSPARAFVAHTMAIATSGDTARIAAAFLVGREDLVPAMFRRLLPVIDRDGRAPSLRRYLERHIEVDEGEHGPLARRLLADVCAGDDARWRTARDAACEALDARAALWDGVVDAMATRAATRIEPMHAGVLLL